jgi:hypothetical protein
VTGEACAVNEYHRLGNKLDDDPSRHPAHAVSLAPDEVSGNHPVEAIPAAPARLLTVRYILDGCGRSSDWLGALPA